MGIETIALVALTTATIFQGERARRETKKARRGQDAARRVTERREKARAIRESQIARAQLVQSAATQGTTETSGFEGGVSSLQAQLASNLSFVEQVGSIQDEVSRRLDSAASAQGLAQTFGAAASLATRAGPTTSPTRAGGPAPVTTSQPSFTRGSS